MDEFGCLPSAATTCTNTATLHSLPESSAMIAVEDLESLLSAARISNVHTQPIVVTERESRRIAEHVAAFNTSQLNIFLRAYHEDKSGRVQRETMRDLMELASSADPAWVHKCQSFALQMLLTELESRAAGVIPRSQEDEPSMLSSLRVHLPQLKGRVPSLTISPCHFRFIDLDGNTRAGDGESGMRRFSAEVQIANVGLAGFTVRIAEQYTVVDGVVQSNATDGAVNGLGLLGTQRAVGVDASTPPIPHSENETTAFSSASVSGSATAGGIAETTDAASTPNENAGTDGAAAAESDDGSGAEPIATIRSGDVAVFKLAGDDHEAFRRPFRTLEQLFVLSVSNAIRLFVSFTIVRPFQPPFGAGFPACIPLAVENSPLGSYRAPLILQILKHQFVRQMGLASKEVSHLLIGRAVNYASHNRETMRAAMRVKESMEATMNMESQLTLFWDIAFRQTKMNAKGRGGGSAAGGGASSSSSTQAGAAASSQKGGAGGSGVVSTAEDEARLADMRKQFPPSSAQPAGYLPCGVLPTAAAVSASSMGTFPNAGTPLPEALAMAPAPVVFALILLFLADLPTAIFSPFLASCDPIVYLETLPPHLKGVLMWVIDLSCAMLVHHTESEVSERMLAMTFASVLVHRHAVFSVLSDVAVPRSGIAGAGLKSPADNSVRSLSISVEDGGLRSAQVTSANDIGSTHHVSTAFTTSVTLQQHITTAFLKYFSVYKWMYTKYASQ